MTANNRASNSKDDGKKLFDGPNVSRRELLNWFLGTSVGAFLVSTLYPVTRYLIPPRVEESTARTVTLSVKPDDVKANSGQIFKFGSQPGILIRTPGGELRAFTAICTHLACTVQYRPDFGHIWCACHNGHFDLNGKNIAGPPPRPLDPYTVNVRGDQIVVSKVA
ncbi:MAG: Rieske 2Fe-2S domain-containing protein [Candidatus Binatia bacterium]|nr:Rieske 2Fe-2S domain-containing protein [Candidatus Binatia bacterium]